MRHVESRHFVRNLFTLLAFCDLALSGIQGSARLGDGLSEIYVTFSDATDCGVSSSLPTQDFFPPRLLFCHEVTNLLGTSPKAFWIGCQKLRLILGLAPKIVPGDTFCLQPNVLLEPSTSAPISLSFPLLPPTRPPTLSAHIVGPETVGACHRLTLDGSGSQGAGGRPLHYDWAVSYDLVRPPATGSTLVSFLASLPSSSYYVEVPQSLLIPGYNYTFSLTVRNFLNATSTAYHDVSSSALLLPYVTINGGFATARRQNFVILQGNASIPECPAFDQSRGQMQFYWTVLSGPEPLDEVQRHLTYAIGNNVKATIFPRMLKANSTYLFQITGTVASDLELTANASVVVDVGWGPLSVKIAEGNRAVGQGSFLRFFATGTDPDDMNDGDWTYDWYCQRGTGEFCVQTDLQEFSTFRNQSMTFVPGLWALGEYIWTVVATKGPRNATDTVTITVVTGLAPVTYVTMDTPTPIVTWKRVKLVVTALTVSSNFEVTCSWRMTHVLGAPMLDLVKDVTIETELQENQLIILPNVLERGATYGIRVECTDVYGTGFSDIEVPVSLGPVGGILEVSPSTGVALQTQFQAVASYFTSAYLPLRYRFTLTNIYSDSAQGEAVGFLDFTEQPYLRLSFIMPGNDSDSSVTITVYCQDGIGDQSSASVVVTVLPWTNITFAQIAALQHDAQLHSLARDIADATDSASTLLHALVHLTSWNPNPAPEVVGTRASRIQLKSELLQVASDLLLSEPIMTYQLVNKAAATVLKGTLNPWEMDSNTSVIAVGLIMGVLDIVTQSNLSIVSSLQPDIAQLVMESIASIINVAFVLDASRPSQTLLASCVMAVHHLSRLAFRSMLSGQSPVQLETYVVSCRIYSVTGAEVYGYDMVPDVDDEREYASVRLPASGLGLNNDSNYGAAVVQWHRNPHAWSASSSSISDVVVSPLLFEDSDSDTPFDPGLLTSPIIFRLPVLPPGPVCTSWDGQSSNWTSASLYLSALNDSAPYAECSSYYFSDVSLRSVTVSVLTGAVPFVPLRSIHFAGSVAPMNPYSSQAVLLLFAAYVAGMGMSVMVDLIIARIWRASLGARLERAHEKLVGREKQFRAGEVNNLRVWRRALYDYNMLRMFRAPRRVLLERLDRLSRLRQRLSSALPFLLSSEPGLLGVLLRHPEDHFYRPYRITCIACAILIVLASNAVTVGYVSVEGHDWIFLALSSAIVALPFDTFNNFLFLNIHPFRNDLPVPYRPLPQPSTKPEPITAHLPPHLLASPDKAATTIQTQWRTHRSNLLLRKLLEDSRTLLYRSFHKSSRNSSRRINNPIDRNSSHPLPSHKHLTSQEPNPSHLSTASPRQHQYSHHTSHRSSRSESPVGQTGYQPGFQNQSHRSFTSHPSTVEGTPRKPIGPSPSTKETDTVSERAPHDRLKLFSSLSLSTDRVSLDFTPQFPEWPVPPSRWSGPSPSLSDGDDPLHIRRHGGGTRNHHSQDRHAGVRCSHRSSHDSDQCLSSSGAGSHSKSGLGSDLGKGWPRAPVGPRSPPRLGFVRRGLSTCKACSESIPQHLSSRFDPGHVPPMESGCVPSDRLSGPPLPTDTDTARTRPPHQPLSQNGDDDWAQFPAIMTQGTRVHSSLAGARLAPVAPVTSPPRPPRKRGPVPPGHSDSDPETPGRFRWLGSVSSPANEGKETDNDGLATPTPPLLAGSIVTIQRTWRGFMTRKHLRHESRYLQLLARAPAASAFETLLVERRPDRPGFPPTGTSLRGRAITPTSDPTQAMPHWKAERGRVVTDEPSGIVKRRAAIRIQAALRRRLAVGQRRALKEALRWRQVSCFGSTYLVPRRLRAKPGPPPLSWHFLLPLYLYIFTLSFVAAYVSSVFSDHFTPQMNLQWLLASALSIAIISIGLPLLRVLVLTFWLATRPQRRHFVDCWYILSGRLRRSRRNFYRDLKRYIRVHPLPGHFRPSAQGIVCPVKAAPCATKSSR